MAIRIMHHEAQWETVGDPVDRRVYGYRCVAEFADGTPCRELRTPEAMMPGEVHRWVALTRESTLRAPLADAA